MQINREIGYIGAYTNGRRFGVSMMLCFWKKYLAQFRQ